MKNQNNNVTLKRRIDKLNESIKAVDDKMYREEPITDKDFFCLEHDARRLADYIAFLRQGATMDDDEEPTKLVC